jgi:hypothetical protein
MVEKHTLSEKIIMIGLIITLIIVGVLLWLLNSMVPMDARIKTIINVIVVICVLLYVLSAFGLLGTTTFPRLR